MKLTLNNIAKNIIEEQSNGIIYIAANDYNSVLKYCPPVAADKNSIDQEYQKCEAAIRETINKKFINIINEIASGTNSKILSNSIIKNVEMMNKTITPIIINYIKQGFYGEFNLSEPINYQMFIGDVLKLLYTNLLNNLQSYLKNPLVRGMAKTYINKTNYLEIIKEGNQMLDEYMNSVKTFLLQLLSQTKIYSSKVKSVGSIKCKNVIVDKDANGIKLPPNKQYNPFSPIKTNDKNLAYTNVDMSQFSKPYKVQLETIIKNFI